MDRPETLIAATRLAEQFLAEVAAACNRFDESSELSRLAGDARLAEGVEVTPLLAELVAVALGVAAETDGSVDPTLGADLASWGYDRDFASLPAAGEAAEGGLPVSVSPREPGWRRVRLEGRALFVPAGIRLDLGASAKAFAADRIAQRVADELGTGVLISLGGDIATAGPARAGGWEITVQDLEADPAQQVFLPSGMGIATSSTQKRRWQHCGRPVQHILDPAFGTPVVPAWRSATAAATSCLRANALSTAAIVRGGSAVAWLAARGADARLVDLLGRVVRIGGWPEPITGPEPTSDAEPVIWMGASR